MKCPIDDNELTMTERQGVEIDYCPKCRGVWLDRGELDKIIDRSSELSAPPPERRDEPRYDDRDRGHDPRYAKKKKRKNMLEEMFDFGG
jgi:uncharacterized protein